MTPDLIARLREQIAQSEAYYEHAHIKPSPWFGMMAEAADALETLMADRRALWEALQPFMDLRAQKGAWGVIDKLMADLSPVHVTVTKAQMRAALKLFRAAFPGEGG